MGRRRIWFGTRNIRHFIVDDVDYKELSKYHWNNKNGRIISNEEGIRPHGIIIRRMGYKNTPVWHKNGNTFDNRRCNLSVFPVVSYWCCKGRYKVNGEGVSGVCWSPQQEKWRVTISINGTRHHLGTFVHFEDAVDARIKGEMMKERMLSNTP